MNAWLDGSVVRSILPVAAIAGAVIYGLNGVLLGPQEARLDEVRSRYAEAYKSALANGTLRMEQADMEERLALSRRRIVEVRERSRPAADQRELFEGLTEAAHESGLDLEQLRALDWKPRVSVAAPSGTCVASACAVSLVGRFEDLSTFVGVLETKLGFTTVTRLHVQPAADGDRVRAELELVSLAANQEAALGAITHAMEEER